MHKLLILLLSVSLFVLCSCNSETRIHRNAFGGHQKEIKYNQQETYSRNNGNHSGSFGFNNPIKHFFTFSLGKKGVGFHDTYSSKKNETNSSSRYNKNQRRVTSRKSLWLFGGNGKRERESSSFNSKRKSINGSYSFDIKSRKVVANKKFFSFLGGNKRERETSTYSSKGRKTKGSYDYNSKRKRVTKKKFLFFKIRRHEKETSTFSGGEARKYFKINVFNKKKRTTMHKHKMFKKMIENGNKKKKVEPDLFNPKMKIKI